jgi:uncharacterized NAD-dependent epimerase/dehydratase family protein
VRQEPPNLPTGSGLARNLSARRLLTVGTDMAIGKMTTSLELHRSAVASGLRSAFVATGQIGICISGRGVPLDAVRVDFASGSVEAETLHAGLDADIVWIEGQGSILHPASTAWLPLLRGSMPTQLILCHKINQEAVLRAPWVKIPKLAEVARLYEAVAAPIFPTRTVGIALNGGRLTDAEVRAACMQIEAETGLPTTDVVRFGAEKLLAACV